MNSGLAPAAQFAASVPGLLLMILGHTLVLVCLCSDMVRVLCVSRSRRRYLANTVFRTLALPAMLIMAASVVLDAASGAWTSVVLGMFLLITVIFRWHDDTDEDHWWKGKGKALGRWLRSQASVRPAAAPAAA